jgi:hypothetical protein
MAFFDVATMTDEAYSSVYAAKKSEYVAEHARLAAQETARKEKEEAEAKARAEEDTRLKSERAEFDRIRKEQEAERDRLREEEARIAAEARAVALNIAAENALREEAMKPDKEKMSAWITAIENVPSPAFEGDVFITLFAKYCNKLYDLMDSFRDEIERM